MNKFEYMGTATFLENYISEEYHHLIESYSFTGATGEPHFLNLKTGYILESDEGCFSEVEGKLQSLNSMLKNVRKLNDSDLQEGDIVFEMANHFKATTFGMKSTKYIVTRKPYKTIGYSAVYEIKRCGEEDEVLGYYATSFDAIDEIKKYIRF